MPKRTRRTKVPRARQKHRSATKEVQRSVPRRAPASNNVPKRAIAPPLSDGERAERELQRFASYLRAPGFQGQFLDRCLTAEERRQFLKDAERYLRERRQDEPLRLALDVWYAGRHRLTLAQAIVRLASQHSGRDPASNNWMLEAIGQGPLPSSRPPEIAWIRERGELRVDGRIARIIRSLSIAKNIVSILDAFQRQNWPDRIASPFSDELTPQELHETVRSLNRGLQGLRFRCDGTGTGIVVSRS
jgi:hypothetical protein